MAVLQQLSTAVTLLTATNATLVEEIKEITAKNNYLSGLERSADTAKTGKEKGRWKKANPGQYIVGGYCHMHRYCVDEDYYSGLCRNPVPLHKREATHAKPMGRCKYFDVWGVGLLTLFLRLMNCIKTMIKTYL